MMELKTENLILRTVTKNDVHEVARMYTYPNTISLAEAEKAVDTMIRNYKQNKVGYIKHLCLAVCLKEKPSVITGWCGLDGEAEANKVVLFYILDEQYRNKGYATQAAKAVLQYAFEQVKLDSVYGGCDKHNLASFKVMRNIGMMNYGIDNKENPQFRIDRINPNS